MFRNGVECISGILVFHDVVQDAKVMKQNEYFGEKYSMPNGMEIPAHAAEVLRQIKGANVVEGGWVGGDAWFGIMVTALEAKKHLNVDSTWIIKGNHAFIPWGGGIACCDQNSVWNKHCRTFGDNDDDYCWHQNYGHGLWLDPERHIVFLVDMWFNRGIFCPLSKRL
jgi:hypothetical protein